MRILGIVLIISEIFSQSYKLEDCVIIALENKRTLLSANLGIRSSEKVSSEPLVIFCQMLALIQGPQELILQKGNQFLG